MAPEEGKLTMKNIKILLLLGLISLSLAACAPKPLKKCDAFPKMYSDRPLAILVLPPINQTTAADAKEYYATTVAEPLSLTGYYVFPIEVVSEVLKNEGVYDTETLVSADPRKFKEFLGADGVLYIWIKKWDTAYFVIGGSVTVGVRCLLKSTTSGDTLWEYEGVIVHDTSARQSGGGLGGLIAAVIVTAIQTATTDYIPVAKHVNYTVLGTIPVGKYNPRCDQDRNDDVVMPKRTTR
jgi:hypothetical protein